VYVAKAAGNYNFIKNGDERMQEEESRRIRQRRATSPLSIKCYSMGLGMEGKAVLSLSVISAREQKEGLLGLPAQPAVTHQGFRKPTSYGTRIENCKLVSRRPG